MGGKSGNRFTGLKYFELPASCAAPSLAQLRRWDKQFTIQESADSDRSAGCETGEWNFVVCPQVSVVVFGARIVFKLQLRSSKAQRDKVRDEADKYTLDSR